MRSGAIKRLAILIAIVGLTSGASFLGHSQQLARLAKGVLAEAELAEQKGDYIKAENLYWQHLEVFPKDSDVQMKYADVHLKVADTFSRRSEALQIYSDILKRFKGRADVRRRQLDLRVEMGDFGNARTDVSILLKTTPADGKLLYMMGRCCEEAKDDTEAVRYYREALANGAPEPIDIYTRLALVLRDRLNQEKKADQAIADMVRSDPQNYKVYLARGRYLSTHPDPSKRQTLLTSAKGDFRKALQLAPGKPDIYLEMAKEAESELGREAAQKVLKKGKDESKTSAVLYEALAANQWRMGQIKEAIATLEDGLKNCPDPQGQLRWTLANMLAQNKDGGKLLLQIEELKKIGYPPSLLQYLNAHYYVLVGNYVRARQLLVSLQTFVKRVPQLKASVNVLLAKCYSQLVEPELEHEAYVRALSANPQDVTARKGLINGLIHNGEIEGAITEYRALLKQAPEVRLPLAALLIQRNRQRPAARRDWSEIETLISEAAKTAPEAIEPIVLLADMHVAQGNLQQAQQELETAKSRSPKNVGLWIAQASIVGSSGTVDEALSLLDQAERKLGDQVDLRLERAKLWGLSAQERARTRGGPE